MSTYTENVMNLMMSKMTVCDLQQAFHMLLEKDPEGAKKFALFVTSKMVKFDSKTKNVSNNKDVSCKDVSYKDNNKPM